MALTSNPTKHYKILPLHCFPDTVHYDGCGWILSKRTDKYTLIIENLRQVKWKEHNKYNFSLS